LRILLVGDTYLPERAAGAVRASEFAQRWQERGHQVTIITGNPHYPLGRIFPGYRNRVYTRDAVNGIPVHRVWTLPYTRGAVAKRVLNQLLFAFLPAILERGGPADVVVASSPPLTIGVAGWLMAKRRGVPFIFDVRDLYPAVAQALGVLRPGLLLRALERLESFVYARAARLVVASRTWAEAICEGGVPRNKVRTIHNGANTDRFHPGSSASTIRARYGIPKDHFVAVYVGLLGRAQGAEAVVDAAERLREEQGTHFLLVGEGADKPRMQARAKTLGLTNVTFAPSVPTEEVPAVLCACNAGLATLRGVPLTKGQVPVKIFEAMACGLPVVLAGWGESEEILREGRGGITVPCDSGSRLAEAVSSLAKDPGAARAMGEAGRAHVVAHYDRRKLADDYLDLLIETLEETRAVPTGARNQTR
jgi:colanic acid biosynthesis glycosyl transferase WcaI